MSIPPQLPRLLAQRLRLAVEWKFLQLQRWSRRRLARLDGATRIALRWPWPVRKPWQRQHLRLYAVGGGIGDELMCLPIFGELKRRNPRMRITFLSRYPQLFAQQPAIDAIEPFSNDAIVGAQRVTYGPLFPPARPLITLMAECVGMEFSANLLPPIAIPEPPAAISTALKAMRGPKVVIQPISSGWSPNKNWPADRWRALIALLLADDCDVLEVGTEPLFPGEDFGPRFHAFAGRTDIGHFAWIVSQASVFVGPVSGGMHLANASRVAAVVVFGGFESPAGYNYPQTTGLYTPVPCAPCWICADCPHELRCMTAITPAQVHGAIRLRMPAAATA